MFLHTTQKRVVNIPLRLKDVVWWWGGGREAAKSSVRKWHVALGKSASKFSHITAN